MMATYFFTPQPMSDTQSEQAAADPVLRDELAVGESKVWTPKSVEPTGGEGSGYVRVVVEVAPGKEAGDDCMPADGFTPEAGAPAKFTRTEQHLVIEPVDQEADTGAAGDAGASDTEAKPEEGSDAGAAA